MGSSNGTPDKCFLAMGSMDIAETKKFKSFMIKWIMLNAFSFNFSYNAYDSVLLLAPTYGRREGHREWIRIRLGGHVPHLLFSHSSLSRDGGSDLGYEEESHFCTMDKIPS